MPTVHVRKTRVPERGLDTRRTRQRAPTSIPPLAVAIAKFMHPKCYDHFNGGGVPRALDTAYAAMPALFAAARDGEEDSYEVAARISGLTAAVARHTAHPTATWEERDSSLARGVAVLAQVHPDLVLGTTLPVADAAFWIGVAFTTYLLTNGGA